MNRPPGPPKERVGYGMGRRAEFQLFCLDSLNKIKERRALRAKPEFNELAQEPENPNSTRFVRS